MTLFGHLGGYQTTARLLYRRTIKLTGYILKGFTRVDLSFGMSNVPVERRIMLTVGVMVLILPLAIVFGKFASCKYICWQAPIMIIGKRIRDMLHLPGLRIKASADKCKYCGACNKNCPMNINVVKNIPNGEIVDDECILCGKCIETCKFGVLKYSVSCPSQTNSSK